MPLLDGRRPTGERRSPGSAQDTPGGDGGSHALRSVGRQHSFNRYEIKYLIGAAEARLLGAELANRLDPDHHAGPAGYGVWNVYYDTADLRFYWEKIEGIRFRRKLRIRHYGQRDALLDDTPVYIEIKQRVNRVTQKRRISLPYREALALCNPREPIKPGPTEGPVTDLVAGSVTGSVNGSVTRGFVAEVRGLVTALDLRPIAITGYQRTAFVGRGTDLGLRVTIDRRVLGRDRDFHLGAAAENRLIVPARLAVLEVKANERVPYWLTDLVARANLSVARISKYCQCIEAYGRAPRSMFHTAVDVDSSIDLRADIDPDFDTDSCPEGDEV